jgi:L-seryl-tRNA(Ser) seleniumtransferase
VLAALHDVMTAYLERTVTTRVPFWRMATLPVDALRDRAHRVVSASGIGEVIDCDSLPGAGSTPGAHIPSCGVALDGDVSSVLRDRKLPIVARVRDGRTILDLRTVSPDDDHELVTALTSLTRHTSQRTQPDS